MNTQNFFKLLKNDDTEKVLELLQGEQNLKIYDKKKNSPLHIAIENQNSDLMRHLVPVIDQEELYYSTKNLEQPIFYCIKLGYWEGVDILLENKVDPNLPNEQGITPLQYAAKLNTLIAVKSLLRHKADINFNQENQGTPVHFAIQNQANEVATYLIEKSIDSKFNFRQKDEFDNTVLHLSVIEGMGTTFQQIIEIIKEFNYCDIQQIANMQNQDGNTILHEAILNKRSVIEQFIQQNQDILKVDEQIKNKNNKTALQIKEALEQEQKKQEIQLKEHKQNIKEEVKQRHQMERQLQEELEQQALENQKELEQAIIEQKKLSQVNTKKQNFFSIVGVFLVLYLIYTGFKIVNNEI